MCKLRRDGALPRFLAGVSVLRQEGNGDGMRLRDDGSQAHKEECKTRRQARRKSIWRDWSACVFEFSHVCKSRNEARKRLNYMEPSTEYGEFKTNFIISEGDRSTGAYYAEEVNPLKTRP